MHPPQCGIRKIRKVFADKKKNEFEKLLLASAGPYLEQGERAAAEMKASSYENCGSGRRRRRRLPRIQPAQYSAGKRQRRNGGQFDKWNFDLQVADLGYFMRKILENTAGASAAERILNAYSARRPLDEGKSRLASSIFPIREILETGKPLLRKQKIVDIRAEYGETKTLNAQQADWLRFVKGSFF